MDSSPNINITDRKQAVPFLPSIDRPARNSLPAT